MTIPYVTMCLAGALAAFTPRTLPPDQPPSFTGDWQIDIIAPERTTTAPSAVHGTLTLSDTVFLVENRGKWERHQGVVGTFAIPFDSLGIAAPIGNRVGGEITDGTHLWARLGKGFDRGEVEIDGQLSGDSVVGQWLSVRFDLSSPKGRFIMHRAGKAGRGCGSM